MQIQLRFKAALFAAKQFAPEGVIIINLMCVHTVLDLKQNDMQYFTRKDNSEGGFTLIELLVVIAIIGILSSVVLASLNTARERSRDARRGTDLQQIKLANELFYDDNGAYASSTAGLEPDYISNLPDDPTGTAYSYDTATDGNGYCIGICLEGDTAPDNNVPECYDGTGVDGADISGSVSDTACDGAAYAITP